tara:strand:- start:446 stop:640 length:195 start_codon:yes stop_codon:yes gene_type:complete
MKLEINGMFATPESFNDLINHPIIKGDIGALTAAMMALNFVAKQQGLSELEQDDGIDYNKGGLK